MADAIKPKKINVKFSLLPPPAGSTEKQPTFASNGKPDLFLTGLRTMCSVVKQGGQGMSTVQLAIFGMKLSDMNQLSTLGMKVQLVQKSVVTIQAGDAIASAANPQLYTVVSNATVYSAYADIGGSSEVPFRVIAHAGGFEAVQLISPTAMKGSFNVTEAAQVIAQKAGLNFEGNGVNVQLRDRTYSGSTRQQAQQLVQEANVSWIIDDATFAIWPKGDSRKVPTVILSPSTGMDGYPSFTEAGVFVKSTFNPRIRYGGPVEVKDSIITPANKTWTVSMLSHELNAGVPGGRWMTSIEGFDATFGRIAARPGP